MLQPAMCCFQTSSLSSEMVGIPSADEYIKRKGEFDVGQGALEELVDGEDLDGTLMLTAC